MSLAALLVQVLIIDGSNLAFSASADRNRWASMGVTLPRSFTDHLEFMLHASGCPPHRFVLFDKRRV